nr:hypothetical protein Iba_chr04bCG13970 [Ipomoea batatas]
MVQSQRLTPPTVELLCFKGCSIVEHVLGIGFHPEFGEGKSLHIERSGPLGQANLRLHSIPQRQFWLTDHQEEFAKGREISSPHFLHPPHLLVISVLSKISCTAVGHLAQAFQEEKAWWEAPPLEFLSDPQTCDAT